MLEWIIILGLVVGLYIVVFKYEKRMEQLEKKIDENKESINSNKDNIDANKEKLSEHYNHIEKLWVNVPTSKTKKDK